MALHTLIDTFTRGKCQLINIEGMIKLEKSKFITIIVIINWGKYYQLGEIWWGRGYSICGVSEFQTSY